MVSIGALDYIKKHLTLVKENDEAALYRCENKCKSWGYNYNIELLPGEYLAVSKETRLDVWSDYCHASTKGTEKRARRAFEKYSPKAYAKLTELFPSMIA